MSSVLIRRSGARAGSIETDLRDAEESMIAAEINIARATNAIERSEAELVRLLNSLFGSIWECHLYNRQGKSIDVFGVIESPAAANTLFTAGFERVTQHEHHKADFEKCACRTRCRIR